MNYSSLIAKAYEEKEKVIYRTWQEFFTHYIDEKNSDKLLDRNISLAVLGLRDFHTVLSLEQKQWCIDTITASIQEILNDTFNRNSGLNKNYNLLEKHIALTSFHFLFSNAKNGDETNSLITLMINILVAPFHHNEIAKIIEYVRTTFFEKHSKEAKRIWLCLIKYSEFQKANPYLHDHYNNGVLKGVKLKGKQYIEEQSVNTNISIDISKIDLETYKGDILSRALVIMPYSSNEKLFHDFIKHFIPLLTEDLKFEEDYSSRNKRQISYQETYDVQVYLQDFLLYADSTISKSVFDLLLAPLYITEFNPWGIGKGLFEFSSKIIETVIYRLDNIIANSNDEVLNKKLIENFWNIWEYIFKKIKNSGKLYFTSYLFLDIKWKEDASHWRALENKKEVYHQMVKDLGNTKTQSMLNLFSTAGEKTFLPDGISWLVEIYKNNPNTTISLVSPSAERMIKRLFYNHISKIKSNKKLIDDFIWILNKMVDYGSSEAYLFRENVMTYKKITN